MATGGEQQVGDYLLTLYPPLGSGTYGTVYKGHRAGNKNMLVAAKKSQCDKEFMDETMNHEYNMMKSIPSHKNIVTIKDYINEDVIENGIERVNLWLILEFCALNDLSVFARRFSLTFPQKVNIMFQCTRGLNHLHSQKPILIHRDIKPKNIVVAWSHPLPVFKLADYGTARTFDRIPEFHLKTMTAGMGTCYYMAPEFFADNPKYNERVDTYSFGVSFTTLLYSQKGKYMTAVNGE